MMRSTSVLLVALALCGSAAALCSISSGDVTTVNFALTLEHLEAQFYTRGIQRFSRADFAAAGYGNAVYQYFNLLQAHENGHVRLLSDTLIRAGCSPVPACTYNFADAFTNVNTFIATAKLLEQTGVSAYDGAVNTIRNADLRTAAALIATVEARHSAVLNELTGSSPFPSPFDPTLNGTEVLAIAGTLISACPYAITLPKPVACNYTGVINSLFQPVPATRPSTCQLFEGDLVTLNFALTLEHLEARFYVEMLQKFNASSFPSQSPNFYTYLEMVAEHERIHVEALAGLIDGYGCDAVPACVYNFTSALVDAPTAVATAAVLEKTGVSAYDGAINTIRDAGYRTIAATIATVEARHSAYLFQQNAMSPFPSYLDSPLTTAQVVAAVTPFLVSCPYTVVGPTGPVNLNCPENFVNFQMYSDRACSRPLGSAAQIKIGQCRTTPIQTANIKSAIISFADVEQSRLLVTSFRGQPCSDSQQLGEPKTAFNGQCTSFPLNGNQFVSFIASY